MRETRNKEGKPASSHVAGEGIKSTTSEVGCQEVLGSDGGRPELSRALWLLMIGTELNM